MHQLEGDEQHPLQNLRADATTGHVSTERAPLGPTIEDLPEESSDPGQSWAQPPLVNGQSSPTGSAEGNASKAGSEHTNAPEFDHDSESKWHNPFVSKALPSPSPEEQSPLEVPGEDVTAPDFSKVGSLSQANAVSDCDDSIRSSLSDSESDMFISAQSPLSKDNAVTADLNGKRGHDSLALQFSIPTPVDKYRNEWPDDPRPDAAQPNASIHPKQDSAGTEKGATSAKSSIYNIIKIHRSIFHKIDIVLRKAQSGAKINFNNWRKKTSETTPR